MASVFVTNSPLATVSTNIESFGLFPNPASGQVTLQLPRLITGPVQVSLFDLSGRVVLTQTLAIRPEAILALPSSLPPGTYLLGVQGPGLAMKPQRLVIQ